MLNLLKRDLKLYWGNMVLPFIILLLVMCTMVILDKDTALAGSALFAGIIIGTLIIPFLPITMHWREISEGTLADLLTLPCSRTALVSLRYIEVLLFSAVMIFLAHLGAWLAQSVAAHRFMHFNFIDRTGLALTAILLLILFAYLMPFIFRWDGKGFTLAFVIPAIPGPLIGILTERFPKYGKAFARFVTYLKDHPGQATYGFLVLFLVLFAISYLLSLKAFSNRDF